jgi:predicted PurR-regulated permease PerM
MSDSFVNSILKNFLKISFAVIVIGLFFYIMLPFMISIIFGGILAMALAPFVDFLIRRGLSRGTSLIVFSLNLGLVALIPVVGFFVRGSRMVSQLLHESNVSELTVKFTTSMHNAIEKICKIYDLDKNFVEAKFTDIVSFIGSFFATTFNNFFSELPLIFMMGLITILSVYCFLREAEKIRALFDRYFYFSEKNGEAFIHMCRVCCREVFFSNIITGILQATIVSVGALVFDIGDFFLVFFITFIVSFIPIIGAAPVAAFLAILCFMDSRFGAGVGMMILSAVSGLADNIIRPYLGTLGEVEVHPFIGLLAVIGGVIMFGLPGLFIGPLIASLIFGALPIIVNEFFPERSDIES